MSVDRQITRCATEPREQTRARYPDETGYVERDGVRVFWERYGDGEPTVLLLPTWSIVHSRVWKAADSVSRAPLSRDHVRRPRQRALGQPASPRHIRADEFVADALAVMDATGTARATLVSLSRGAARSLLLWPRTTRSGSRRSCSSDRPCRCRRAAPRAGAGTRSTSRATPYEAWGKCNRHYWARALRGVPGVLLRAGASPSRTRPSRSRTPSGGRSRPTPRRSSTTELADRAPDEASCPAAAKRVRCPTLVIHGTEDADPPPRSGRSAGRG